MEWLDHISPVSIVGHSNLRNCEIFKSVVGANEPERIIIIIAVGLAFPVPLGGLSENDINYT